MIVHRAAIRAWLAWDASGFFEWLGNRPWYTRILEEWVDAIPVESGDRGLEVGCGPGLLTGQLQGRGVQMTGLDRSEAMVRRARNNLPECTFLQGDALDLPVDDDAVHVAFAASVVNVVSDPQRLVGEMSRVVRPGGRVSVLFPTPRLSEDAAMIGERRGVVGLSAAALATWGSMAPKRDSEQIEALFEAAGLLDVRADRFFDDSVASVTGSVP